jgi:tetratricopeptide (TPR) repeat protein
VATCLAAIGDVYRAQSKHSEALDYFERCLCMRRRLHGVDSLPVAEVLNVSALSLMALERFDDAHARFMLALAIHDLTTRGKHPNYETIWRHLLECERAIDAARSSQQKERAVTRDAAAPSD